MILGQRGLLVSHLEVNLRIHDGLRAKRSAGVTLRGESEDPLWFEGKEVSRCRT